MPSSVNNILSEREKVKAFAYFYIYSYIKESQFSKKLVDDFVKRIYSNALLLEQICINTFEALKSGENNIFYQSKTVYQIYIDAKKFELKEAVRVSPSPREDLIAKLQSMPDKEFAQLQPDLEKINLIPVVDETTKRKHLLEAKIKDAKAGFNIDLDDLTLSERKAFFKAIYQNMSTWKSVRDGSTVDFILDWIEKQFPDRRRWDMTQADLMHLDKPGWERLQYWKRDNVIPVKFGLPEKKRRKIKVSKDSNLKTGREISARLRRGVPVPPEEIRRYERERKQIAKLTR